MAVIGRLHSVESLGALDGPGLRTVFFLQGCNMKCLYCHNRDTWNRDGGKEVRSIEIVETAMRYRDYYGESGGVTFSGGEPLLQSRFLLETVALLKEEGIHTALDTSGSVYNDNTEMLIELLDLVILDIKSANKNQFMSLCNRSAESTLKTLDYLQRGVTPYWIRQVIVEGFTDTEESIDSLKELLSSGIPPEKTELLAYHSMGVEKWTDIGEIYPLEGVKKTEPELMNQLKRRLDKSSTLSRK